MALPAQHHLDETVKILAALDLADLTQRIRQAAPGIKAQSFDGPMVSSGQGPSDPTGSEATAERRNPDSVAELNDLTRKAHAIALALAKLDQSHRPPAPGSRDRLTAANEPSCWFCDHYHHEDRMRCGPLVTQTPTDVGGRLDVPRLCGRGHYDGIRRTVDGADRLPSEYELDYYARTGRWPPLKAEAVA